MKNTPTPSLAQRGVALVFALIGLVVLTLGAVALIRSVDTGVLALGNLSYKQSALNSGARGADAAVTWLTANMGTAVLNADRPAQGYYASAMDSLDPTGRSVGTAFVQAMVDWDSDGCQVNGAASGTASCIQAGPTVTTGNGDTVRYVITRMCNLPGDVSAPGSAVVCLVPPLDTTTANMGAGGGCGYKQADCTDDGSRSSNPYFRVITRTVSAKNTISYTETMAHY